METLRHRLPPSRNNGATNRLYVGMSHHRQRRNLTEIGPVFVPPIRTFYQSSNTLRSTKIRTENYDDEEYSELSYRSLNDFNNNCDKPYLSSFSSDICPTQNVRPQMSRKKILAYLFDKTEVNEPFIASSPVRVRKNAIFSRTDVVRSLVRTEKSEEEEEVSSNKKCSNKSDKKSEKKKVVDRTEEERNAKFIETLKPKIQTKFHKILSTFRTKCSIVIFSMPEGRKLKDYFPFHFVSIKFSMNATSIESRLI